MSKQTVHTITTGDIAVAAISFALQAAHKTVLIPVSQHLPYDLAIDESGVLRTIQCKNARLNNGVIIVRATRKKWKYKSGKIVECTEIGYEGQVDYFGVYCPETQKSYLIPADIIGNKKMISLRVNLPKYKTAKRMANDFEIKHIYNYIQPKTNPLNKQCLQCSIVLQNKNTKYCSIKCAAIARTLTI